MVKAHTMGRRDESNSETSSFKGVKPGLQRRRTVLLNDADVKKKDTEFDWRDRLKQWKQR